MGTTTLTIKDLALGYVAGGLALVPCSPKDKRPDMALLPRDPQTHKPTWKSLADHPADAATVQSWLDRGCKTMAAATGKPSGGLLIIDFDEARFLEPWKVAVAELADGLPVQRTGRGFQVALRCPDPGENAELAWVADEKEETGRRIAIETRGEGGYAILPGSLHPSGKLYAAIAGDWANIATVSQARADSLLAAAKKLDEAPYTKQEMERKEANAKVSDKYQAGANGKGSTIDLFNKAISIEQALKATGYTQMGERWARPGADYPSVTVRDGRSYHHSTNDLMNDGHWHRAFDLFCQYKHNGDCKAAVKVAAEKLGVKKERKPKKARKIAADVACGLGPTIDTDEGRTEVANAKRLVVMHGADMRFCESFGSWFNFDGAQWKADDRHQAERLAKIVYQSLWAEICERAKQKDIDPEEVAGWIHFAKQTGSARGIEAMLRLARSEPGIPVVPDDLDRDPWVLNCPNGTVDLRTAELRPHRREDMLTKLCPTAYDPAATCPIWLATLDTIMAGNSDLIGFLQRAVGSSLAGVIRDHTLFVAYGTGQNGKSTFLNAIQDTIGTDYSMKAPLGMLMARKNEAHPTERADLFGRRFVSCIEVEDGQRLAESLVKELTGGDRIRARFMRQDFFEFTPTHHVWLAVNHKPTVRGTDTGIWRRIKLIPFSVSIPEEEQDKTLPEKLQAERTGILAWAVQGCLAWQQHGLGEPDEVRQATSDYRGEQDVLATFLEERCEVSSYSKVRASELYAAYADWTEKAGEYVLPQRRFGQALTERGFEREKNNGIWYRGLGLTVTT